MLSHWDVNVYPLLTNMQDLYLFVGVTCKIIPEPL